MTLWLIPKQTAFDTLQKVINELSEKYQTPSFQPHITLLSRIELPTDEIIKGVNELINGLSNIEVQPNNLDTQYSYFHSLYLLVAPNPILNNLHQKIRQFFHQKTLKQKQLTTYMPHFSLMYSELSREVIDAEMSQLQGFYNDSIILNQIWLVDTSGAVEHWKIVATFDL